MKQFKICLKSIYFNKSIIGISVVSLAITAFFIIGIKTFVAEMTKPIDPTILYLIMAFGWAAIVIVITILGQSIFISFCDDTENDIIDGLNTTPLSGSRYVLYKSIAILFLAFVLSATIFLFMAISFEVSVATIINGLIAIATLTFLTSIISFVGLLVTNDRMGALAFMKLGIVVFFIHAIPMFMTLFEMDVKLFEWLFYIFPGALSSMHYLSSLATEFNQSIDTLLPGFLYAIWGPIVMGFQVYILFKLANRKINN